MNIGDVTDRGAVLAAIAEFDAMGESAFLAKYAFGPSRSYFLLHNGRRYPSKAVMAAAYAHQFPERQPLTSGDFSGGRQRVVPILERLGFQVEQGNTGSALSSADVANAFQNLKPGNLDGRPTPHKFLLAWLALRDLETGRPRQQSPSVVADELSALLTITLPAVSEPSPWEPIWRLDPTIWEIVTATGDPRGSRAGDPQVALLRQPDSYCGLTEEVAGILLADNVVLQEIRLTLLRRLADIAPQVLGELLAAPYAAAPRVWWVNQGVSFAEERQSGYVWASANADLTLVPNHHLAVRLLQPHDLVVHYTGSVVAIGEVQTAPEKAARPGSAGAVTEPGYLASVTYFDLDRPIGLDEIIDRPTSQGPFDKNGAIKQGYLFPLDTNWAQRLRETFADRWPTDSPWAARNHWLFQANPNIWNLAENLEGWAIGETKDWTLSRHRKDVREGDDVVLFAAGSEGGILAFGTLVGEPLERRPEWRDDETELEVAIKVRLTRRLSRPITRATIRNHPVLRNMAVMRFASATNFPVTDSEWSALMTLLSEPSPTTSQCLAVYVGQASEDNLRYSLSDGRWGFKTSRPNYSQLQVGDLVVLGNGYTGGSPRVQPEEFALHGLRRCIVGRVTSPIEFDDTAYWPDEQTGDASYPYRFTFLELEQLDDLACQDLDAHLGGPVAEGLRMSAINQGRGELVECTMQPPPSLTLSDVVDRYAGDLRAIGYHYGTTRHDLVVRTFVTSLCTKRFVILTGLSGSGKTKLAQHFGNWLGDRNLQMVAVRPDWTNPDPLLGYEDGLSEVISGERAWHVPQALEFMLQAAAHPNEPYLLLLDEMNLAHVERYFADVLSGMESGHPVLPNLARQQGEWRLVDVGVPRLPLPANLFIVGTVNVDETTYMFSPKVLDRANTIEFRVHTDELMFPAASNRPIASAPAALKAALLAAATEPVRPTAVGERMADWLRTLHSELSKYGREFGHRTFAESIRFAELLVQAGENDAEVAFDLQVLQKVLPKYHGSIRELGAALNALGARCFTGVGATAPDADFDPITADAGAAALPLSFDKVKRMAERLRANHFVSFAE